jgi:hypothetical protein
MITGFNTEQRYEDESFHVQTEDRGLRAARIDTIIYRSGGSVVHRKKLSYRDILNCEGLDQIIRELMEEIHFRTIHEVTKGLWSGKSRLAPEKSFEETVTRYFVQPGVLTGLVYQPDSEA